MSDEVGLNEDEYLALVERIQRAMCIEPFCPDVADVVILIGTVQVLNREVERLTRERNIAVERMRTAEYRESLLKEDIERLRAENDELRTEFHVGHFQRLEAALEKGRNLVEDMDLQMPDQAAEDKDGWIVSYRIPVGPWHRLLGWSRGEVQSLLGRG